MFRRFKLAITLLCCLSFNVSISFADTQISGKNLNYDWGRGLTIPQAHLNIGGYINASINQPHAQKNSVELNDLSLFISWSPYDRIRFFSEIELEDWLSTNTGIHSNAAFRVERLYVDLLAPEAWTLRLGKFLTPVGYWNVAHAAPLVWTTTRPLATNQDLFPAHVSGLMVKKSFTLNEHNLDLSLYIDDSSDLDIQSNTIEFTHAIGGRVHYELFEQLQLGFSYLAFNKQDAPHQARNHLLGADLLWKKNDYELQMEWNYRYAHDFQGSESNFYLQTVAPLYPHLFAVARYEYRHSRSQDDAINDTDIDESNTHLGIVGLAWRPFTPLAIKAEYRLGRGNQIIAPSGFFTSISMFF